jgi:glucose-6-phosphate-specific signal transduction histidine kinase
VSRRDYGWVILPSLVILLVAPLFGESHLRCSLIAVALTLPVALLCLAWMRRVRETNPKLTVVVMLASSMLRILVAFGGGALVFFAMGWASANDLTLGIWIAVAYLSTLTAEAVVLARPGWIGTSIGGQKG